MMCPLTVCLMFFAVLGSSLILITPLHEVIRNIKLSKLIKLLEQSGFVLSPCSTI